MSNLTQELITANFAARVQAFARLDRTNQASFTIDAARALALSRGWADPAPERGPLHPGAFALDWLDEYPPVWPWAPRKEAADTPQYEDLVTAMYWLRVEGQLSPHAAKAQTATRLVQEHAARLAGEHAPEQHA
jgi:hypothetical protein